MYKTLIIVPAYNEAGALEQMVVKLKKFCHQHPQINYVVIDDGSSDQSVLILEALKANYIVHPINLGIGEPYKTGIKYGLKNGYHNFINFDADGQHQLSTINKLLLTEGDYIVGSRYLKANKPFNSRMLGSRLLTLAIKLRSKQRITDPTSGLVCIKGKECANFFIKDASNKPEPSIFPKISESFKVCEVEVEMDERLTGNSYFNVYTSLHFMLEQLFLIILKG